MAAEHHPRDQHGDGPGSGDPVVFVHVMKCGGSSLRQALSDAAAAIPSEQTRREVVELSGDAFKFTAGLLGTTHWQVRDIVLCHSLLQPTTRIAMGHVRWVDGLAPLATKHVHFVTVLRDPVERFVSLYRYRTYGNHPYRRFDGPIEDLLDERPNDARRMGAAYVEVFRGGTGDHVRPVAAGDVEAAVTNLGHFSVVGMLDDMAAFERDMSERTGLPISMPHLNTSRADPVVLDPGLRRAIEEVCQPDIEVYESIRAARDRQRR